MKYKIFGGSIQGARERQEDCTVGHIEADGSSTLVVVADGMGGHVGGDIASTLAVSTFTEHFYHYTCGPITKRLEISLAMANQAIGARVRDDIELDGMGTTLLAVHCSADGLYWINVGDSPLLLIRDGVATRLNEDHSMAPVIERLFLSGQLTLEQAAAHPDRSDLLSVLTGLNTPDMIDLPQAPFQLMPKDRLIAASDGIATLPLSEIAAIASQNENPADISSALLSAISARAKPAQDNATLQVIIVE